MTALAAGAVTAASLAVLLSHAPAVMAGETVRNVWTWVPEIGLNLTFRLDGLSLLFAGLILFIGLLIVLYAAYYLAPEDSKERFYGLLLLFMMDFHHVVFRALVDSYTVMPLGGMPDSQKMLITLTDTLSQTFMLMLRLASPFMIFGLMFNVAVGLVNKLAPQVPVFYISTPYLLLGGLILVYFTIAAMVMQFGQYFPMIFNF